NDGGARAQLGIYSFVTPEFAAQAATPEGVYVAMEWYFPSVLHTSGDAGSWLSLWDWHSTGDFGLNRWHTSPGMFLWQDGSMRFELAWFFGDGGWSGPSRIP